MINGQMVVIENDDFREKGNVDASFVITNQDDSERNDKDDGILADEEEIVLPTELNQLFTSSDDVTFQKYFGYNEINSERMRIYLKDFRRMSYKDKGVKNMWNVEMPDVTNTNWSKAAESRKYAHCILIKPGIVLMFCENLIFIMDLMRNSIVGYRKMMDITFLSLTGVVYDDRNQNIYLLIGKKFNNDDSKIKVVSLKSIIPVGDKYLYVYRGDLVNGYMRSLGDMYGLMCPDALLVLIASYFQC